MNIVQEYYENYNFTASEKLNRLLKKDGHNFKKKDNMTDSIIILILVLFITF